MSVREERLRTPPPPPWSSPVEEPGMEPAMIGSTPGQNRTDPRRLPSPVDLPDGRTVDVVVAEHSTASVGSIPAGGTKVVVDIPGGAVVAVDSTPGTGDVVEAGIRFVEPSASAVGIVIVPETVLAAGAVVVAAGKLGTVVGAVGVVVGGMCTNISVVRPEGPPALLRPR